MGFDSKCDFAPPPHPIVLLGPLLCPWTWVIFFWWDPTFSCRRLFSSELQFWSPHRRWAHVLLLCHLESCVLVLSMELHTFVLTAENRKNYLKVVNVLPRPFPVTYVLGRHQREISQKERANPELTAVEVLPRPSPITYILSSEKACP